MKKKRWYRIFGISEEQLKAWSENLREDIKVLNSNKDGEIFTLIRMNWFEAIRMRLQMIRSNKVDNYGFQLKRM